MRTKQSRSRSRTSKKGQKTKYRFPPDFSKTCRRFKLRPDEPDLFNLRAPPFPFLGNGYRGPGSANCIFFCCSDMSKREARPQCGCSVQGRGKRSDGLPCGPSPDHNFAIQIISFRPVDSVGNAEGERASLLISMHQAPRLFPFRTVPLSWCTNLQPSYNSRSFGLPLPRPVPAQTPLPRLPTVGRVKIPRAVVADPRFIHALELGSPSMKSLG